MYIPVCFESLGLVVTDDMVYKRKMRTGIWGICRDLFLVIFFKQSVDYYLRWKLTSVPYTVLCTDNKNGDVIAELCRTSLTC